MALFKVGIIGTGLRRGQPGATGYGMAHFHAAGYEASPDAEIVAVADIDPSHAEAFCAEHKVPRSYTSADDMLANEELDIVSVCLWPHLHAPMTIKAAEAGVKAVHCEKPMAVTYGEAKAMVAACEANGVQLSFNHMRRLGPPFRRAKALLKSGVIGDLERLEAYTSNLYDWGTHWFDMLFYYNDDTPVEWLIGQFEPRGSHRIFGALVEGQGLALYKFRNGVAGLMVTGGANVFDGGEGGAALRSVGCANRLIGSRGTIEVGVKGRPGAPATDLRYCSASTGGEWQNVAVEGGMHGENLHAEGVLEIISALKTGREPELSGRNALRATELIFATYESSRKHGRVDMPLEIEDSPFITMLNMGDITTWPESYVEANGIKLHYWRTGDGTKPAVVLCHGFSDNGLCWTPVARELESDYDVIMVDARGHGLSEAPETGYTTADRAADVAEFVKALGLEKPAILGHSMGGSTAGEAAATYPDLFSKALLEDPAWFAPDSRRATLTPEEREQRVKESRERIIADNKLSREALIARCREQSPKWSDEELGNWAISKQQLSPNVVASRRGQPKPWEETAAAIGIPTLLITADTDKGSIVTSEIAAQATEINPKIQVVNIAGAGHNIRREAFDAYMEAVKAFLAQ